MPDDDPGRTRLQHQCAAAIAAQIEKTSPVSAWLLRSAGEGMMHLPVKIIRETDRTYATRFADNAEIVTWLGVLLEAELALHVAAKDNLLPLGNPEMRRHEELYTNLIIHPHLPPWTASSTMSSLNGISARWTIGTIPTP